MRIQKTPTRPIVLFGVTWLFLMLCPVHVLPAEEPAKKTRHRSAITISKETTRITEPVDELGYVDYVAAINQRASKGVTPKNNAAVLLWEALGVRPVEDWSEERRKQLFGMLGIEEPKPRKDHFVPMNDFANRALGAREDADVWLEKYWDQYEIAQRRPWTKKEFPMLAAWLAANESTLRLAEEASRRSRFYSPKVALDKEFSMLMLELPLTSELSGLSRMFLLRAMQSTAAGDTDAAWADLLACWRMGRLATQGSSLIDYLIGLRIEAEASVATASFIHAARLTDKQLVAMQLDIAALSKRTDIIDRIDFGERYSFLDIVQTVERNGPRSLREFIQIVGLINSLSSILDLENFEHQENDLSTNLKRFLLRAIIDWDLVLRQGNAWYDRLVADGRIADYAARAKARERFKDDMMTMRFALFDGESILRELLSGKTPRRLVSERISGIFTCLLIPSLVSLDEKQQSAELRTELLDTAFALKFYHNKHGKYPDKLDALVPKYVKAVPVDIYTDDSPVRYEKTENGYLLYSIGVDQKDGGGPNVVDESDADDVGFRVPAE